MMWQWWISRSNDAVSFDANGGTAPIWIICSMTWRAAIAVFLYNLRCCNGIDGTKVVVSKPLAKSIEIIRPFYGCMHDSQYANISASYLIGKDVLKITHHYLTRTKHTVWIYLWGHRHHRLNEISHFFRKQYPDVLEFFSWLERFFSLPKPTCRARPDSGCGDEQT